MNLLQLKLSQFKNYPAVSLDFEERIVCICGLNGAGKTNLLDAIHYLSTGKSATNSVDTQNIQHGSDYFTIEGEFELNEGNASMFCGLMKGQKKRLRYKGEEYKRLVEHYGKLPSVMISPPDISLVTEGSEERRKFIDSTIATYNAFYLDCLLQYNAIITQRNAHLKEFKESREVNEKLIDVYNKQLNYFGNELYKERVIFEKDFAPIFMKMVKAINEENEALSLQYSSQLMNGNFLEMLRAGVERDRILGRTDTGPHKDQWVFEIDERPLKKFGSQGQQKSHLLALKLAKAELIRIKTKKEPLLLLDDVFDRLDDKRVVNLIKLINANFGQVFITDTSKERLKKILNLCKLEAQFFHVESGKITAQ